MIRMIVSDLDRTLTGKAGKITNFTKDVIRRSQNEGIRWLIATGRSFETVEAVLKKEDINIDMILLNGAEYRSADGKTRYCKTMDMDMCKKMISFFRDRKIDVEINTSKGNYATAPRILDASDDLLSFEQYDEKTMKVMKIFAFSKDIEKIQKAKNELKDFAAFEMNSSADWNLELCPFQTDKAQMLKTVAKEMGISKKEIVVFGDGENDKGLFEHFCYSRAVANAIPQIKAMAEKIIESCEEDGVAKEVLRILKNNENEDLCYNCL